MSKRKELREEIKRDIERSRQWSKDFADEIGCTVEDEEEELEDLAWLALHHQ